MLRTRARAAELLTQALKQALALEDVRVLERLVITGNETTSFAECRALPFDGHRESPRLLALSVPVLSPESVPGDWRFGVFLAMVCLALQTQHFTTASGF